VIRSAAAPRAEGSTAVVDTAVGGNLLDHIGELTSVPAEVVGPLKQVVVISSPCSDRAVSAG
jgi:hypothetical protein